MLSGKSRDRPPTVLSCRYPNPGGMVENLAYLVGFLCLWPVLGSNALNANKLSGMFVGIRREVKIVGPDLYSTPQ